MCRLLGYATREPTTLAALLGERDLHGFTELSCKHRDGWGVARATGLQVEVEKAPDSARLSTAFARTAHDVRADLALVHLRWATLGLPVVPDNAHPFTDGRLAFAHNGSVPPPTYLDPLLADDVLALRRGDTDSERLFLAVLSRLDPASGSADPVGDAYAAMVSDVTARLRYTSLNSMVLTADRLYAVCCFSPEAEHHEDEDEYYTLRYRISEDAVLVSSSGWGEGWHDLANGSMLVVDRGSLATTVRSLDAVLAGR